MSGCAYSRFPLHLLWGVCFRSAYLQSETESTAEQRAPFEKERGCKISKVSDLASGEGFGFFVSPAILLRGTRTNTASACCSEQSWHRRFICFLLLCVCRAYDRICQIRPSVTVSSLVK